MLLHWFLCFFGNLGGCLFVMAIIVGCKSDPANMTQYVTNHYFQMEASWTVNHTEKKSLPLQ
jgi:hypothetical protein